jgi:hypothetical protein
MRDDGNSFGDRPGFSQNGFEFARRPVDEKFLCSSGQSDWPFKACRNGYVLNFQTFNDIAFDQMLIDDFINVVFIDIGIPGFIRVNHDNRPFIAAIQATCIVDADFLLATQFQGFNTLFGIIAQFLSAEIVTAFGTAFALIGAKKDMILIIAHSNVFEKRWK